MKARFWLYVGIVVGLFPQVQVQAADAKEDQKALYARLENDGCIGGPQVGYELWVPEVTAQRLLQPILIRLNARGGNEGVASAKEAEIQIDTRKSQLVLKLREGVASSRDGNRAYFDERVWWLPLPVSKERK